MSRLIVLYDFAYTLLYPSSYEGLGIPVLEAQKAGCPVVAMNTSSVPEVIGEMPLLINNVGAKEIEKKLALLNDATIRNNIMDLGLKNAKRFTRDKMYEGYKELYLIAYEKRLKAYLRREILWLWINVGQLRISSLAVAFRERRVAS